MQDEILKTFDQHIFYHGTSYQNATGIIERGYGEGVGLLGSGVYITCNWLIALWAMYWKDVRSHVHSGRVHFQRNKNTKFRKKARSQMPPIPTQGIWERDFGETSQKSNPKEQEINSKRIYQSLPLPLLELSGKGKE
jgi:hypothetical protein|tara:strand:- start:558 stop:968 length:411 start_codon:yes stop_codon:yes gene_type:complete